MIQSRSVPAATIIPVFTYDDDRGATAWRCGACSFRERLRIEIRRARLALGGGAVISTERPGSARRLPRSRA
jgi:hypothetical protein